MIRAGDSCAKILASFDHVDTHWEIKCISVISENAFASVHTMHDTPSASIPTLILRATSSAKYLWCSTLWKGKCSKRQLLDPFIRLRIKPWILSSKTPRPLMGVWSRSKRNVSKVKRSSIHASYLGLVVYIDLSHPLVFSSYHTPHDNRYFLLIDKFELRWHRITINPTSQHHPQHLVMGIHSHLSDPLFWNIIILLNINHPERGGDHSMKMILNYIFLLIPDQTWRRVWSYLSTFWWCL